MPSVRVIEEETTADAVLEHVDTLYAELSRFGERARLLRGTPNRRVSGRKPAPLRQTVTTIVEPGEDPASVYRQCAIDMLDVIVTTASGEPWAGIVEIIGEADERKGGRPPILATVKVKLDDTGDASPKPTRDSELTGVLGALKSIIEGMGVSIVKIANAKGAQEEATARLYTEIADSQRKLMSADRKWDYKIEKERQETEREVESGRASAAKSRAFWDAFESTAVEYKDLVEIWSRYYTQNRKPGDPGRAAPKAPTIDEIGRVMADETFEKETLIVDEDGQSTHSMRGLVAEMIAEPDFKRRLSLAKRLRLVLVAQDKETQDALKLKMLSELGAERAQEVAAWLSLPVTPP